MRNLTISLFALVCSLLLSSHVYAQGTGNIQGKITEAGTDEPLFGANVLVTGSSKGAAADRDGNYVIKSVPTGTKTLRISYLGYQTITKEVEVEAGETLTLNFSMAWAGVEGEEINITAQAQGQISAINEQRASNTISNIVSKDRIEELPDVNAAESLGRLPGISLQRSGGEANKIVVRGLSPKYNTVTVNGVRLPSTDTNNRSVDLSLVSSNMLDGIEVKKALTPDQDADAIGGTVDLKLRNASAGLSTDLQLQGGYTALQKTYDNYKVSASIGDRFINDQFGLILNFNADRYDRSADFFNGSYSDRLVDDERIPIPSSLDLSENALERSRLGGSLIADYKIPSGKIVFNTIFNKLTNNGFTRGNTLDYGGRIHKYTLNEGYNETYVWANGLNIEQDYDWLKIDGSVSFTSSESESPKDYYWEFREEGAALQSTEEDTLKPADLPGLFKNDLSDTGLMSLSQTWRKTNEDVMAAQLNLKFPFKIGSQINGYFKTGGKIRALDRSNNQNTLDTGSDPFYGGGRSYREAIANAFPELNLDPINRLPLSAFQGTYTRDNFLSGDYPLGYSINPSIMREISKISREQNFMSYPRDATLGNDYNGKEEFTAFYAMTELKIGNSITFMPGFRFEKEHTKYSAKFSTGLEPATGVPLSDISYTDTTTVRNGQMLLPMVHLQYSPADWLKIRLAYTETLSRPDFKQFAPITYYNAISNYAFAPNKDLKSSRSHNYDVSVSMFQNKLGFFTVSAFYKEIEDLVWGISFKKIPGQNILPDLEIIEAGSKVIDIYSVINNPNMAYIKGIELDWQTNFWYLPSVFKGLVLNVNYTHLLSETEVPAFRVEKIPIEPRPLRPPFSESVLRDTTISQSLPDQPNDILNLTMGYDYKGFSTRISFFYQLGSVLGRGGSPFSTWDDTYKRDYFRVDVSVKQKLPENFEVYANLNNLNSEGDRSYQSPVYEYPTNQQFYGFTMDVGVRYKF